MKVHPLDISYLTEQLERKQPFSLVRYGDGEFYSILGASGANCDGAEYNLPKLRESLAHTLTEPRDYLYCIGPKVMNRKNGITEKSVEWIEQNAPSIRWHTSETILEASLAGNLKPLTQALGKVMIVGPVHLRGLPIPFKTFVQVPTINAWLHYDMILYLIRRELYQVDTILFSAGFVSKCAIWSLFPSVGETHNLIDIGSSFDSAVGVDSRSYSRKLTLEQKIRLSVLNFGISEETARQLLTSDKSVLK